ncbi:hypothetical protein N7478_000274 [Penicillium angulare]|uniref:uncharacterized protein n=1 Tax=Penicillium angulare TaxID=116970 RepID=UPI0025417C0A|nr:uncharacterized protein N7478_000274 [Penicillium angulare]KAJ5291023.1 hypothetical protein N7478_000274 [Penicillium angulare]
MHSGVGPAAQLKRHKIEVVHDIPSVGEGLRDHCFVPMVNTRTDTSTDRKASHGSQKAMDNWVMGNVSCELDIGWFKPTEKLRTWPEFLALPEYEQRYLLQGTVPHFEMIIHSPTFFNALNYHCFLVFLFNAQTRGQVMLQSSDADAPLLFDAKFLAHPFYRRLAVEAPRGSFRYTKDSVANLAMPQDASDEELLGYWLANISSSWNMTGTVKMGKSGDSDAIVDADFKVIGIENLRIADMGVVPVLVNAHIQVVAYVTGVTCAEKLQRDYQFNQKVQGRSAL